MTKESPEKAEAFHIREGDVFAGVYVEKGSMPDKGPGNGGSPVRRDPDSREDGAYGERLR